ncbi:putative iron-regulated membrane protein [Nocardiopsis mwathae]|uniref:Putative iron-regulated membrane protein n=1 Tax=Nocardiopsis mwathae TaxID=1472723 RepID=A0A7X0D6L6_9ACTN|nr:PepSY domain-containing protein [Nocardiopsis mwathae]MBB6173360.1 putative iron-regulated membrane protein [Nocardiopsis mwathae]
MATPADTPPRSSDAAPSATAPAKPHPARSRPRPHHQRYRTVWRWHFYAGLFVAPVLLVLAVTGGIYLFKDPYEEWRYSDLRTLDAPVSAPVPLSEQVESAQAAHPDLPLDSVIPPAEADRSTRVILKGTDAGHFAPGMSVYVDPASAHVLGSVDDSATLMRAVRDIHGSLMAGDIGDMVVETAACWAVILVATGTYLWWRSPARRRSAATSGRSGGAGESGSGSGSGTGSGDARAPRNGRRLSLRRLHALTGITAGAVIVLLVLTGLPWSGVWGGGLRAVQEWTGSTRPDPGDFADTSAPGTAQDGHAGHGASATRDPREHHPDADVPWAAQDEKVPTSAGGTAPVPMEAALAAAHDTADCPASSCDYSVLPPQDAAGVYTVTAKPRHDPADERTVRVDQYTGEVVASYGWAEYGVIAKGVSQGIAIHEGRRFGTANLILMLAACVAIVGLVVTGTWMWWRRRPRNRIGAPARPTDRRTAYGVIAIMAVLGLLFPLAGISMLIVLAIDALILRRVPALRTMFG